MGITNLRFAHDIMSRAPDVDGRGIDQVCLVPPAEFLWYLDPRKASEREFARCSPMLSKLCASEGCWVSRTEVRVKVTTNPPDRVPRPRAMLSPAIGEFWRKPFSHKGETEVEPSGLLYLAVVHGLNGAAIMKVVTASSRAELGRLIFAEMLNSFSIALTAAVFEDEFARHLKTQVRWKRADSFEALEHMRNKGEEPVIFPTIGVYC
jgi:hypothetical protein